MSQHTDIVDAYMEGFRRSDKPGILARVESYIVPLTGPSVAELAKGEA